MKFPDGFFWGAATSSHQVEGGTHNNWTVWEQSVERLSYLKRNEKKISSFVSGHATNHRHLFQEDFSLAQKLGHNATRLSIEWARIEPQPGVFDEHEIRRYKDMIRYIRSLGIEPFVTLWHWTHPVWFDELNGFEHPDSATYFRRFVAKMAQEFDGLVRFWIPLNEPIVNTFFGYVVGLFPPQKRNYFKARKVKKHLLQSHIEAYEVLKSVNGENCVGIAKNNIYFEGRRWNILKRWLDKKWNFSFLDSLRDSVDFIGLNYYFRVPLNLSFFHRKGWTFSDIGWPLYPKGIYHVLHDLHRYKKPIFITEHGLSDKQDTQRAHYIFETLQWVHKAISEGVDIRGYLHWSLIDNFEWIFGYKPRFGLVEIDYKTFRRIPRLSARLYKKICESNRLDPRFFKDLGLSLPFSKKSFTVSVPWLNQKKNI